MIDFGREKGAKREALGEPKWSQNEGVFIDFVLVFLLFR